MRVLHLVSGNLYGGVEALLATLAKYRTLAPDMTPAFGLCFPGRLSDELERFGCRPVNLGSIRASRPWTVLRARRALAAALRDERADAAICHGAWTHAMFGPVLRQSAVPSALFVHDVARGRHWVERWARLTPPQAVIANSRFTAATTGALFPRLEASVYYCPVPNRSPEPGERDQVRAELGILPDQVVILQASRMQPWKGQREHLHTLAKLKALPHWLSVQAGGPQRPSEEAYFAELKQLARDLGIADRVRFLGQRSDVPRLLSGADIHFQPNLGPEPFGIAFIEAMLAGLPVVTFHRGGPPEFVTADSGFVSSNSDELLSAVTALIQSSELRTKLGRSGARAAHLLCDPARQLPELSRIIQREIIRTSSIGVAKCPAKAG